MPDISSYTKVYNLGHRDIQGLFDGFIEIEEKVDGSQFSFGILDGELVCRSHKQQLILDAPEKMFILAVEAVRSIQDRLMPGWVYRGEYLEKRKQNVLVYDRIPKNHIILFDIMTGEEDYLSSMYVALEAERLGLESVPIIYSGDGKDVSLDSFKDLLETVSILGGQKVEGVVVKNRSQFNRSGKFMAGKYVSPAFKEVAGGEWRKANPTKGDILDQLIAMYRTPARWHKAVQHLEEQGLLTNSPQDIGKLIGEVGKDVYEEEAENIKEMLFKHFWKNIQRGITGGLPEWYKEKLLTDAFPPAVTDGDENATETAV